MSEELTTIAANIVSAFVSHNSIRAEDMVDLLKQVHSKLAEVMKGKSEPIKEAVTPAVPIKKSITHDAVFCLICGDGHKTLKRHLRSSHNIEPAAYRAMFDLKSDYTLTAPSYSETRSSLAASFGLGRKAKVVEPEPEPEAAPSEPLKEKKAKEKTAKPVRSHSKAEQTRRKTKAPKKDQEDAESASEAA